MLKHKRISHVSKKIFRAETQEPELPPNLFNVELNECYSVTPLIDILGKCKDEETIFVCPICQCILSFPSVQTPCEHNFCAHCLSEWFRYNHQAEVPCPVCKAVVHYTQVSQIPRILRLQLSVLLTVCSQCGSAGKLDKMANHTCPPKPPKPAICHCEICSKPATPSTTSTCTPSPLDKEIIKAAELLRTQATNHKKGSPIPKEIEAATDAWTWLKLLTSGRVAQLKTPGRVCITNIVIYLMLTTCSSSRQIKKYSPFYISKY